MSVGQMEAIQECGRQLGRIADALESLAEKKKRRELIESTQLTLRLPDEEPPKEKVWWDEEGKRVYGDLGWRKWLKEFYSGGDEPKLTDKEFADEMDKLNAFLVEKPARRGKRSKLKATTENWFRRAYFKKLERSEE